MDGHCYYQTELADSVKTKQLYCIKESPEGEKYKKMYKMYSDHLTHYYKNTTNTTNTTNMHLKGQNCPYEGQNKILIHFV